ncbi:hypothetical protein HGB25_00510 [Candidatus Saccharibacteria bacterium]|nr:hypothetical protein [Candidatus Saccharibacteria bacterium]
MKQSMKVMLTGLLVAPIMALGLVASPLVKPAFAACSPSDTTGICGGANATVDDPSSAPTLFGNGSLFKNITNTALYIIGALSVIMLIYGGIRYTISMGDSKNVEAAKSTIIYAIMGVVVALLAFAIVNFVLTSL